MNFLAAYGSDSESQEQDDRVTSAVNEDHHASKRARLGEQHQSVNTVALPSAEALLADVLPVGTAPPQQHVAAAHTATGATSTQHQAAVVKAAAITLGNGRQLPPEPARIRTCPHVEGNFATVVYITVEEPTQAQLRTLATTLLSECPSATSAAASTQAAPTAGPSAAVPAACSPADNPAAGSGPTGPTNTRALHLWPTFPWTADPAAAAPPPTSATASQGPSCQGVAEPQQQQQQQLPLHMSISRTVPIRRVQIDSLQAALTKQLKPFKACSVQLQGLVCLANDAGTRSFVGIKVAAGEARVVRLVEAVNRAFITHGLQTFYEVPLPHVSLAWTPGDQTSSLQPWLDTVQHEPIQLKVSQVVCQIGKMRHVVWQG